MFKLEKEYWENVEKFVGNRIEMEHLGDGVEFIANAEIKYRLIEISPNNYAFQIIERGQKRWEVEYKSNLEMKRRLALTLKGYFGKGMDYSKSKEFRGIKRNDLEKVEELMKSYIDKDFFSINQPEILKVNLEQIGDDKFNIYVLLTNGDRIYVEENAESSFAFPRFYNEALFMKENLQRINQYQEIFGETLTDYEIEYLLYKRARK